MDVLTAEQAVAFESTYVLGVEAQLVDSWEPSVPGHRVLVVLVASTSPSGQERHHVVSYVDGVRLAAAQVEKDSFKASFDFGATNAPS